jgi:hypothetical protein
VVLGVAYEGGSTVPKDDAEAIKWLTIVCQAWYPLVTKTDWGISITTARVFGKIILRQFGGSVRLPSGTTRQPRTILDTCT